MESNQGGQTTLQGKKKMLMIYARTAGNNNSSSSSSSRTQQQQLTIDAAAVAGQRAQIWYDRFNSPPSHTIAGLFVDCVSECECFVFSALFIGIIIFYLCVRIELSARCSVSEQCKESKARQGINHRLLLLLLHVTPHSCSSHFSHSLISGHLLHLHLQLHLLVTYY